MRFAGRAAGIYHVHAMRLAGRDGQIRMANASEKCPVFLLKAVLVFSEPFSGRPPLCFRLRRRARSTLNVTSLSSKIGQVGLQVAAEDFVHLQAPASIPACGLHPGKPRSNR